MPMDNDCVLLAIAGHGNILETSTVRLAAELEISQQSVSRKLIVLENEGMITREASPRGITIQITQAGNQQLRKRYLQLKALFEGTTTISGKVISSLGEGSYYLQQKGYQDKIKEKLGFTPYPGTLNLKTDDFPISEPVEIPGFKTNERSFGALKCYPILIGNPGKAKTGKTKAGKNAPGKIRAAIVVPSRTHHNGVIEIIAPTFLREELKIKDGDVLEVEVLQ